MGYLKIFRATETTKKDINETHINPSKTVLNKFFKQALKATQINTTISYC